MAEYPFTWPGLPGGPISFSFPMKLNLVPAWRTAQRPGIKARRTRRSIQHENGNRRSGARSDSMYLFNGAEGRQASWHASVDHLEGYANLPADEVGWQAGDGSGPGNMNGFATELCQLSYTLGASEWRRARRNAAELMGRVAARIDASPPHEQHNNYSSYGKNCPELLRSNSTWWNEYKADWKHFHDDEKRRMVGGVVVPDPVPVAPKYGINDLLGTTTRVNLRRTPGLSGTILTTLDVGATITVTGRSEVADGLTWIPVLTSTGSGYIAESDPAGTVLVKMVKDNPDPVQYAKRVPIPVLLDTDVQKEENVVAVETDDTGNEFIYVRDVVEFTVETKAGQYAGSDSLPVKEPYKAGERVLAAWLCRAKADGTYHYILTGGDDEWVRVPQRNTIWITDAPLQGDDEEEEDHA